MKSLVAACLVLGLLTLLYTLLDSPDDQLQVMIREQMISAQDHGPGGDQENLNPPQSTIQETSAINEAYAFGERCMWTPGMSVEACSAMCLSGYRKTEEYESCNKAIWDRVSAFFAPTSPQSDLDQTAEIDSEAEFESEHQIEMERRAKLLHDAPPSPQP